MARFCHQQRSGACVRACGVSTCTRARGCVLTIYQMGTADTEILSRSYPALSNALFSEMMYIWRILCTLCTREPGDSKR